MKKHIILTAKSASSLIGKIEEKQKEGWNPIGSHKVVEVHHQLRYSGMQHKDTIIESEYSQTMVKIVGPTLADKLNDSTR